MWKATTLLVFEIFIEAKHLVSCKRRSNYAVILVWLKVEFSKSTFGHKTLFSSSSIRNILFVTHSNFPQKF
jgi:hypothetical protein